MVLLDKRSGYVGDERVRGVIKETPGGWKVVSESGKNLSGVLKTLAEAKKRLAQVEYFKHRGK